MYLSKYIGQKIKLSFAYTHICTDGTHNAQLSRIPVIYIYSFDPDNNILPIASACMRYVVCARMIHGCTTCVRVRASYTRATNNGQSELFRAGHISRERERE